jgi:spermidine synthase
VVGSVTAAPPSRSDAVLVPILLVCFVLSGFAGLLYETAWLREFAVVFGTSELAVAAVLAAYMAGLAVGAAVGGPLAARVRRPVLAYGCLELAIALSALAVPWAVGASRHLLVAVLGGQAAPPDASGPGGSLLHLAAAFVILAVPTGCMGATLPVLARFAVRRAEQIGGRVGLLYAANTAGAVAGALVTAFVLLPWLGQQGTILVGVGANAVAFVAALVVARCAGERAPASTPVPSAPRPSARAAAILPIMLVSGAVAFTYEVLWTRLLGHVLGGSIAAFATMLASFLAGIAVGSAIASRLARDRRRAVGGLVVAQAGAAGLGALVFRLLDRLPALAETLGAGAHASLAANGVLAAAAMLLPTLCLGATFPFAVRVLAPEVPGDDPARVGAGAGRASARVYAWNTVGAIVGAVGAGFVLIPALGFAGTAALACGANLLLAVACLGVLPDRPARGLVGASVALAIVAVIVLPSQPPHRLLRYSPLLGELPSGAIVSVGVGRSATVLMLAHDETFELRTNGMPEARISRRGGVPGWEWTRWLTALPALARPEAESVLVVGLGGGVTLSGAPPAVRAIDVIEIEPGVVAANRAIAALRRDDPLADPRVRVVVNDARSAMALTTRRYDVVVSQPSHPWTAGASHLYTREFLALVRERLAPGGVFVQWMNSRFVDEALFRTLGATLLDAFPHVRLHNPYPDMLVFLASDEPIDAERGLAGMTPATRSHFARLGLRSAEDVAATLLLDGAGLRATCGGAAINTDDRNRLATRARRAFRDSLGPDGTTRLAAPHDALGSDPRVGTTLDLGAVVRRLLATDMHERAAALVDGDPVRAWPLAARAETAAAVTAARMHADDGAWSSLRGLDAALAAARPTDACFPEAAGLRATWRVHVEHPDAVGLGREALSVVDEAIVPELPLSLHLVRLEAAVRADDPAAAVETASAIAGFADPASAAAARAAVRRVTADERLDPDHVRAVLARLEIH